jgi:superfamily II DNA helicase RecQ
MLQIIIVYTFLTFFYILANLIQEIGRAGRDGNEAKSVIFYSIKKDLRTNFGILAENREM